MEWQENMQRLEKMFYNAFIGVGLMAGAASGQTVAPGNSGLIPSVLNDSSDSRSGQDIKPSTNSQISETSHAVPVAVPLPRTWEMGLVGLLVVACVGPRLSRRLLS